MTEDIAAGTVLRNQISDIKKPPGRLSMFRLQMAL